MPVKQPWIQVFFSGAFDLIMITVADFNASIGDFCSKSVAEGIGFGSGWKKDENLSGDTCCHVISSEVKQVVFGHKDEYEFSKVLQMVLQSHVFELQQCTRRVFAKPFVSVGRSDEFAAFRMMR
jgi:hypothetical protein